MTKTKTPTATTADRKNKNVPAAQRALGAFAPELSTFTGGQAPSPSQAVLIPVASVSISDRHTPIRMTPEELEGLAGSIRTEGLHVPIVVIPQDKDAPFSLVDGRHRLQAFQMLGLPEIPAQIRVDLQGRDVDLARALINLQRKNLPPYDEAQQFRHVLDAGYTQEEAAAHLGVSVGTIRNRLRLLELPQEIGQRVGEAGFGAAHADVLVGLAKHPELLKVASKAIGGKDYDGRPLDVEAFTEAVAERLFDAKLVADPTDYHYREDYREVANRASFWKKVADLPKVKLTPGGGRRPVEVVTDVKRLEQIVQEELKDAEAEFREAPKRKDRAEPEPAYKRKERERAAVYRQMRARVTLAVKKAAKAVVALDRREMELVALVLLDRLHVKDFRDLAEITGIPEKTLSKALGYGREDGANPLVHLVATLNRKKDQGQQLGRLLVGACLLNLRDTISTYGLDGGRVLGAVAPSWLGAGMKELQAKVRKEIREEAKQKASKGKKAKPKGA